MESGDLRKTLGQLQRRDQSGRTDMEIQFSVSRRTTGTPLITSFSVCLVNSPRCWSKLVPTLKMLRCLWLSNTQRKTAPKISSLVSSSHTVSVNGVLTFVCCLYSGQVEGADKGRESGLYQC